ncbi:MAG: ammonium transporter [Nitrososphaerales archaeon]
MAIDSGDTAFVLISAALVMAMTPALGFFYGGLVRRKNVLAIIMQCFIALGIISVLWILYGYSLAFGPDKGGFIGGLEWLGLKEVGLTPSVYAPTIPHQAYMIFQAMFAVITPALIVGAFADRMKFSTFLVFTVLWATFVYDPIAHWVWGAGGWLRQLGVLDFAGGTAVHINAGIAALAAALIIGKRKGFGKDPMVPHDIPMMVLGTGFLWFGWFGFNAGSAVASGALSTIAFIATFVAAAAATLTWMFISWIHKGVPSVIGACTGTVAGLVAITPASGFVDPLSALAIGFGAGIICYLAVLLKIRMGFDDALDVWAVHGIGGTWGALATGIFASTLVNPAGNNGLLFGNPSLFGIQVIGVVASWAYSFTITLIILKILDKTMGLRVSPQDEAIGLDMSQHAEEAYSS